MQTYTMTDALGRVTEIRVNRYGMILQEGSNVILIGPDRFQWLQELLRDAEKGTDSCRSMPISA